MRVSGDLRSVEAPPKCANDARVTLVSRNTLKISRKPYPFQNQQDFILDQFRNPSTIVAHCRGERRGSKAEVGLPRSEEPDGIAIPMTQIRIGRLRAPASNGLVYAPLAGHVVSTLIIGFGFVIPDSPIEGANPYTLGFLGAVLGFIPAYAASVTIARRRQ